MHLSMSPGTTPSITLGSAIQILQEKREEEKERERERERTNDQRATRIIEFTMHKESKRNKSVARIGWSLP